MPIEHQIIHFLYANQRIFEEFGLSIILLASILESVPLVGFVIPGQTLLMLGGIFSRIHVLSFWKILLIGAVGSFLGDVIAYTLGRNYSEPILKRIHRFVSKERVNKITDFTERYAGKSIFFGRFNSVTRSLAPFIAGISNVTGEIFFPAALFSGLCWSTAFVTIGFAVGEGFQAILPAVGKFLAIATLIALFILYLGEVAKKRGRAFSTKQKILLIISIVSLYSFALIAQNIRPGTPLALFDQQMENIIVTAQNPTVLYSIWWLGLIGPWTFSLICLAPTMLLVLRKRIRDALFFVSSIGIAGILIVLLKAFFSRPRPLIHFFQASSSSFPSGHTILASVFFSLICYEVRNYLKKWQFILLCIVSGAMILLVGFSRIYFGIHWVSDVIGGLIFGIFFVSTLLLISEFVRNFIKRLHSKKI